MLKLGKSPSSFHSSAFVTHFLEVSSAPQNLATRTAKNLQNQSSIPTEFRRVEPLGPKSTNPKKFLHDPLSQIMRARGVRRLGCYVSGSQENCGFFAILGIGGHAYAHR